GSCREPRAGAGRRWPAAWLVEVEKGPDALAGKDFRRTANPREVGVVVMPRGRLDRFPDQTEPHAGEAVAGQERRVVGAEPDPVRRVRRELGDHVEPVGDQRPCGTARLPVTATAMARSAGGGAEEEGLSPRAARAVA